MSFRRLRVLIHGLPPESATMTALRNANPDAEPAESDPAKGRWAQLEMLVALLVDEVRTLTWVTTSANSEKGKAGDRPEPLPRPGVVNKRSPKKFSDAQYDFLFRHINGLDTSESGLRLVSGGGD